MILNFNCIPNEVVYVVFSSLPFGDARELSMTSYRFRALFFSYLKLNIGDQTALRSLQNRCNILSIPFLQHIRILSHNSAKSFFSLALADVKILGNQSLIHLNTATMMAPKEMLLRIAENALTQNNTSLFLSIAKNPSLQTVLSFQEDAPSQMDHSKLLSYIIREFNAVALQEFVKLDAYANIPCGDWIEHPNGQRQYIAIAENELHLADHIIRALDADIMVDFAKRRAFVDIFIGHEKFNQIPQFFLGIILCATLEDGNLEIIYYTARCICPRITTEAFYESFMNYFSENSERDQLNILCRFISSLIVLRVNFRRE